MNTSQRTVQQRLREALIVMTIEQMERFEEKDKKGLQDWERMHIAEAIVGPIKEVDHSRGAANIRESRSVLQIELDNRANNNTKAEQSLGESKERQYNAYRKGGMSEADASAMSGFTLNKS